MQIVDKMWSVAMRIPWWMYMILVAGLALSMHEFGFWSGLIDLSFSQGVFLVLALTHVTIVAVTIYLHRMQAHSALELHPIVSHFFRFWLWLTTGMVTKEWAAVHRKHHAKCETVDDPHSPKTYGFLRVLFTGVLLYVKESHNKETLERYGSGTPDDWVERNLYTPHKKLGVVLLLFLQFILFGPIIGVFVIWLTQMWWIPFFAAGVINGVGHKWGYRNFASMNKKVCAEDQSTNIVPWGILIGGEELHNNHHYFPQSAKLSAKWFEFDLGWFYIRILEILGLAKAKYAYGKRTTYHEQ